MAKKIKRAKKAINAPNSGIFLNSSKVHLERMPSFDDVLFPGFV